MGAHMKLGAFSVSLAVRDNILTFNPGWDENANKVDSFTDIKEIQRQLKSKGIGIEPEADESSSGPASFSLADPDGNPILSDQHV